MSGADDVAASADPFADFVSRCGPGLVRLARGLLRDSYQAEDVVQDVLAKALAKWKRVSVMEDPEGYVRKMVVNACMSWFRRPARREFTQDDGLLPEGVLADPTDAVDERDRVMALLNQLPQKQRATLFLRHYQSLPDAEIANLLHCSEPTVRSNAHRALATLRKLASSTATAPDTSEEPSRP